MKLSIIVPVYNVEKFLPRCLDSLLRQGLGVGEYEIICVNDGSPDCCAHILREYEQTYPDIFRVITQENLGLGEARNAGLKVAQGEWIGFVDPDDYVINDAYKYILDHFCEEKVDVVHFNHITFYSKGNSLYDVDAKPDGNIIFEGDGVIAYNSWNLPCVWSKLYKRAFLEEHRILFDLPYMEDEPFNFDVFRQHPCLRIVSSNIYRYEQGNSTSLMTINSKIKIDSQLKWILQAMVKMDNYLQKGNGEIAIAAQRALNTFGSYYYNKMLKAQFNRREWREHIQLIKNLQIQKIDVSQESSFFGKSIIHLKNWSGESYIVYFFVSLFLNNIFATMIRPRIIASHSRVQ